MEPPVREILEAARVPGREITRAIGALSAPPAPGGGVPAAGSRGFAEGPGR